MTLVRLQNVLKHLLKNKSLGPDHWHPHEVRFLLNMYQVKLIEILHQVEKEGRWPENLRYSTVTLTPKPKATHEGQLRPIGLLPMIYRIWMSVRKPQTF